MTAARWSGPPRGRRWIALAAALLVQGAAVSLLWMDHGWRLRGHRASPRLTEIRLLPLHDARPPRSPRPPAPEPRRIDTPRLPAPIVVAAPEVTVTAPVPSTSIRVVAAPEASASGASAPLGNGRSTLNLALPKGAATGPGDPRYQMADQVRNDPRSHSPRRTVESAIADAAGTLPVTTSVSTSGSGSKVIRQGSKCVRAYENRVAELNPSDDRLKDAPMLAGSCFGK